MSARLTLLVFLKDRAEFTKRLCEYLSEIHYPYPVYFADGSLADDNEDYLGSNRQFFFSYVYKRFPKDLSLSDYYQKCYHALCDVKTPYVMIADNDDFPIPEGQSKAIQFLENNSKFIGCNGQVAGISLSPNAKKPYGKNFLFHQHYCQTFDVPVKLDQTLAIKRIESYLSNFYSIFYSIFRTESLVCTYSLIKDLDFSDLGIHELFFSYMQLAQGKVHSIDAITYIRQKGSSQTAAVQKDWFHRLFYTNWLEDSRKAIHTIAEYIAINEKINVTDCYKILYELFVKRMRERYIPNDFYLFKNVTLKKLREYILSVLSGKLFAVAPSLTEQLTKNMSKQVGGATKAQQKEP